MNRLAILTLACLSVAACGTSKDNYIYYLQNKGVTSIDVENFQHCYGYGCKNIATINLSSDDWQDINNLFTPAPQSAEEERAKLAQAIGLFEIKVGAIAGTDVDKYGTFRNFGNRQLDCVDESTNTTIYLSLLKSNGYLKFHDIEAPTSRLPLLDAGHWPHQSAVITEIATSKFYAVDSWFHDNGYPAEIVSLRAWKEGWKPEAHKQNGDSTNKD